MGIDIKQLLENYLDAGKILICVDSNVEGVQLPDHLMNSIQVKINLSRSFKSKIFEIDDFEKEVRIDLGFNGERFLCVFPFSSIWYVAIASTPLDGVEIIENMPIELLELSYHLEAKGQQMKELAEKQIDFMSSIPKEKAQSIELTLSLPKPPAKKEAVPKSAEDKLFDDFMNLVQKYEAEDHLKAISKKVQKKQSSKKESNEIDFTLYLNKNK